MKSSTLNNRYQIKPIGYSPKVKAMTISMKNLILVCFMVWMLWSPVNGQVPDLEQIRAVADQIGRTGSISMNMMDDLSWTPESPVLSPSWIDLRRQMLIPGAGYYAEGNEAPFVMMAGYMDTNITWEEGGVFKMIAWAWDPDNDVVSVELYYEGVTTGVFLLDDGNSGDFDAGDDLYGMTFDIPPYTLPEAEYILELRACDTMGNLSDLWPYLTIHPW
ncbi:hypothetical protein K8T06_04445 [bacterium]|nr:hypothetical protein [bacterium]